MTVSDVDFNARPNVFIPNVIVIIGSIPRPLARFLGISRTGFFSYRNTRGVARLVNAERFCEPTHRNAVSPGMRRRGGERLCPHRASAVSINRFRDAAKFVRSRERAHCSYFLRSKKKTTTINATVYGARFVLVFRFCFFVFFCRTHVFVVTHEF